MPNLASTTASQDIPATPTTAKTLLLLTSRPGFDRTTNQAGSESVKSSIAHIEKLPFEEPTTIYVLPNAANVQLDIILVNQQTIMANQLEL